MGGPEADGGDGEEEVLAWVEGPGTGHGKGYADGVAWEGFNRGFCAAVADVSIYQAGYPQETLEAPEDNDDFEVELCWEAVEMVPKCYQSGDDEGDVKVKESLVEGASEDSAGL